MKSKNYLTLYYDKLEVVTRRLDDSRRGVWLAKIYEYETTGRYEPTEDELLDALIEMTIPDLKAAKIHHQERSEKAQDAQFTRWAKEKGITLEEIKADYQARKEAARPMTAEEQAAEIQAAREALKHPRK